MPYRKNNVGATPYYVRAYETRFFTPVLCERIYTSLREIGIDAHKSTGAGACELTYLDCYSAHVEDARATTHMIHIFKFPFT